VDKPLIGGGIGAFSTSDLYPVILGFWGVLIHSQE